MSQIGELTGVAVFLEKHDDQCYFCNQGKKDPLPETNDPDDEFAEDGLIGLATAQGSIRHDNDGGKLGQHLGSAGRPYPGDKWVGRDSWAVSLCVQHAAHHLIPGNGSLKDSDLFNDDEVGIKTKGKAVGNVGYDVNAAINGIWLPGNYAFANKEMKRKKQGWGREGAEFEGWTGVEPQAYASAAIEKCRCQFHDSHGDYNSKVKDGLNEIYNKLRKSKKEQWCPEAAKEENAKRPLYTLVGRLATVSLKMKRMLELPTSNWRINVFTSNFSRQWMEDFNRAQSTQ
jgi:hypothetical protein